jgi:hypothetical protein
MTEPVGMPLGLRNQVASLKTNGPRAVQQFGADQTNLRLVETGILQTRNKVR